MISHLPSVFLSIALMFIGGVCLAQSQIDDTQHKAINTTVNNFNSLIGQQSWLYNGAAYNPGRKIKGNPNFMDTLHTVNGEVTYYGFTYSDVPLLYDIHKDLLTSVLFDETSYYSFTSEKVTDFSLMGHHFIWLSPNSTNLRIIKQGYYDNLYNNKLQVLAKRAKIIHIEKQWIGPDDYYETKTYYYLKKNDRYYPINGEGDFLSVLKDHQTELDKYIKDNKIKFRDDPEQAMVMLATYYDQLTN